jgi:hypothetical protein
MHDKQVIAREKASKTRAVGRMLDGAADVLAKRAGMIELHAAKNGAAGFDRAQTSKLKQAGELRRIAVLLSDSRIRDLVRGDTDLADILLTDRSAGHRLARPRVIAPDKVTPTKPWAARATQWEPWGPDYIDC